VPAGSVDTGHEERATLTGFAGLAILAAVVVIALKLWAWWITGSVGLLSDAVESLANLAGALMAFAMLWLAARPPDDEHAYGHTKAEYFSSGFEGGLILMAGAGVLWVALPRLLAPQPVDAVAAGLAVAAASSLLNGGVAVVLLRAGRRYGSITLEAGGRHLVADVWTSVGVIGGVGLVALTGWHRLDAVVAIAVAVHIFVTGARLVRRSALGLLDTALPEEELARIHRTLARYEAGGIQFHALRTRRAGRRSFVSMHVLVPGEWTVQRAHDLAEEIEVELQHAVPGGHVFTHLEPVEDPASFRDVRIRPLGEPPPPPGASD
jgi:cation diffusion facilitator family transporter